MTPTQWATQRERGSLALLRLMLWIIRHLGGATGWALLYPIAGYFFATSSTARAASREFLTRALGRPARTGEVFRHIFTFSAVIFERVFLLSGRLDRFAIEVEGLDDLKAVLARGVGCMLLGAHFGSFEALRVIGRHAPVPVRPVMFRRNTGAVTRVLEALDPVLQAAIIEIGQPDSMLRVRESVARGEMVGLLADRAPREHRMIAVPFLGSPAAFPTGPFVLAATLGVPVMLFYGIRTGQRHYTVKFTPFADAMALSRTDRQRDLSGWIARYAASLEVECRAHPFNWFNFYRFWEAPPDAARQAVGAMPCLRVALMLAVLALAPPALAQIPAVPLSIAPSWVDELMRRLAQIPDRRANFREERRFAALDQPLLSQGWLVYRRPAYLQKTTTGPEPEDLRVDGDRLTIETAHERPHVMALDAVPEVRAMVDAIRAPLAGDLARLQRSFRVTIEGSLPSWRITLAPTDPRMQEVLRSVVIDGTDVDVRSIRIAETNGDSQLMTIQATP